MRLPANPIVDRRDALLGLRPLALAALLAPLELAAPPRALAISATTMSGKSKPELGIFLVDAVKYTGSTVSADLVISGGRIASIAYESKWPLAEGGYYDVEVKSKSEGGDGGFVQVASLPKGQTLATLKKSWFLDQICDVSGRYGAYGQPIDAKVLSDSKPDDPKAGRTLDISFTALAPGGAETQRRAAVSAVQSGGDVLMLVAGSSASRWKKGSEADARFAASSFRLAGTRASELQPQPSADYRFGKTSGPSTMTSRNDGF